MPIAEEQRSVKKIMHASHCDKSRMQKLLCLHIIGWVSPVMPGMENTQFNKLCFDLFKQLNAVTLSFSSIYKTAG